MQNRIEARKPPHDTAWHAGHARVDVPGRGSHRRSLNPIPFCSHYCHDRLWTTGPLPVDGIRPPLHACRKSLINPSTQFVPPGNILIQDGIGR